MVRFWLFSLHWGWQELHKASGTDSSPLILILDTHQSFFHKQSKIARDSPKHNSSWSPGGIVALPVEVWCHVNPLTPVHRRHDSPVRHPRHSRLEVVHDPQRLGDVLVVVARSVQDADGLVVAGSACNIDGNVWWSTGISKSTTDMIWIHVMLHLMYHLWTLIQTYWINVEVLSTRNWTS